MMIGELDYTDMLVENIVNNDTVPGTGVPLVPLPSLTIILFFTFVLMVSVVLVNLLVCTYVCLLLNKIYYESAG